MAFDPRLIDDLARRLAGSVPESVVALRRDLEQNFKGVLQSQLTRLDLVTREEFDVQREVLARTRAKLEALEAKLAELESQSLRRALIPTERTEGVERLHRHQAQALEAAWASRVRANREQAERMLDRLGQVGELTHVAVVGDHAVADPGRGVRVRESF